MTILYFTFYFAPDLSAGSFRNTALVRELAAQLTPTDQIHVITTQPNRYDSHRVVAPVHEYVETAGGASIIINRVNVPPHKSAMTSQVWAFWYYFTKAHLLLPATYDLVIASSSRLFTAFLAAKLARQQRMPLILDIRDIFRANLLAVLTNPMLKWGLKPTLRLIENYAFGYARHINLVSPGFENYFKMYPQASYTYHTNGIDNEFLNAVPTSKPIRTDNVRTVLYVGNIGEGQVLHQLIPEAARRLGNHYQFLVVGNGGARPKLMRAVEGLTNVVVRDVVKRAEVARLYEEADYLLVHLNAGKAFEYLLPSKLFEYGATDKPILAGVAGYTRQFMAAQIENCLFFSPGNVDELIHLLTNTPYYRLARPAFVARFRRDQIMPKLARQMLQTLTGQPPTVW